MSDYNFGAKERFDLTKEQVLETLKNYEKIMERVEGVAGEIGFTNREFNMLEEGKTEFTEDEVYVTAYDSHYDLYDSRHGLFPLDFLFEDAKCPYDFVLEGEKTLSLKTNKGKMVCPPEVGQPGSKTCWLYFKQFLDDESEEVNRETFKKMILHKIEQVMPIYVDHMFDSDWLLWIYQTKDGYEHKEISRDSIKEFIWEKDKFTFTKPTLEEWNESNTVKYNGITLGEFQVHKNRNCYKFRFQMHNLLKMLKKDNEKC